MQKCDPQIRRKHGQNGLKQEQKRFQVDENSPQNTGKVPQKQDSRWHAPDGRGQLFQACPQDLETISCRCLGLKAGPCRCKAKPSALSFPSLAACLILNFPLASRDFRLGPLR